MKKRIPDFDTFICEGLYSSVTLNISRQYIKEFKEFLKGKKKSFDWKRYIEIGDTSPVRIKTIHDKNTEFAYDMEAGVEWDDEDSWMVMDITITINKEFFPMAFNDFIAELKETLRHEIEHVAQQNNPNKGFDEINTSRSDKSFAEYVLSSEEIPAYLQGFLTKAKTKKESMTKIINDFIDSRKKWFNGNTQEMQMVKDKLIEIGKKMFPNAVWD